MKNKDRARSNHPKNNAPGQAISARGGSSIENVTQIYAEVLHISPSTPSALKSHIQEATFTALIEERTRHFVGREFVFAGVDRILSQMPSGYILIRGEPGIGKTSLLAQLVKERGWVHHFNIAPQNVRSTRAFLSNVCAQLILRYGLKYSALPPDSTQDSGFLSRLLAEAATSTKNVPIVVLVDALDEAEDTELASSVNRLYLPAALPNGAFFVLTSREQVDFRLNVDRREDIYLRDDDPQNLGDVTKYIQSYLTRYSSEMAGRLAGWKVTTEEFVELMTEKSQGNFMYLVHVLHDVRAGILSQDTLDDIHDLPKGLRSYYERHWRLMRGHNQDRFEKIYEPVLRILATVREPVSIAAIQEWTRLDTPRIVEVVRDWRPFLNEERTANRQSLFRVYHASFQEFLAQEGPGLRPYHELIAQTILRKIPGMLVGKPGSD
jgi:hypothetical protein